MSRIRAIKPDAFKSESLSAQTFFTRWLFAGLWTYLDDEGYGRADPRLIRSDLFPLDDDVTAADVAKSLDALEAVGSVCRYTVAGREIIHCPNWQTHQKVNRPTASRLPRCPEHDGPMPPIEDSLGDPGTLFDGELHGELHGEVAGEVEGSMEDSTSATDATVSAGQGPFTAPSLNGHGVLSEGSLRTHGRNREQGTGNREQGTGTSPSADADGFPAFWAAYPRKIRKVDASKAYAKALKRAGPQAITAGLERHLPIWEHTEPGFIPHAATWLNGDRWEDEPTPSRARPSRPPGIPEGW